LKEIFLEDLTKFLALPANIQNKMILAKFAKKAGSLKGKSTLAGLFKNADKNKDGKLNKAEWLDFSA
jgi:hypothetical protein